jgi:hypothetical protein
MFPRRPGKSRLNIQLRVSLRELLAGSQLYYDIKQWRYVNKYLNPRLMSRFNRFIATERGGVAMTFAAK